MSLVGEAPTIVTVAPALGAKNLKEFVELAKAKPGTINYGSAGIGTATHLAGAYFALKTDTDLVHVPYTVSAAIIADLLGGRIQASFVPAAFVLPLLQDGRLARAGGVGQGAGHRSDHGADRLVAGHRLSECNLVRHSGAGEDTESLCSKVSARRSRRPARTPSCRPRSACRGSIRGISGWKNSTLHIQADMARLDPLLKAIANQR